MKKDSHVSEVRIGGWTYTVYCDGEVEDGD